MAVDTKEFYQLRERVGLIQADVSHILDGQHKQNGYIKDMGEAIEALTTELEDTKRTMRPYQVAGGRAINITAAIVTGVLLTVILRLLGI